LSATTRTRLVVLMMPSGWTKSTAQVWLPGFERRLHDLEQAATGEGGELQLRVLRSADLRAGDRGDSARHQRPVQWLVEHHVNVVALAVSTASGICRLIGSSTEPLRSTPGSRITSWPFSRPPPSPKARSLFGFQPVEVGPFAAAATDLDLNRAAAIPERLARTDLPTGIGEALAQGVITLHQARWDRGPALR